MHTNGVRIICEKKILTRYACSITSQNLSKKLILLFNKKYSNFVIKKHAYIIDFKFKVFNVVICTK